MGLFDRIFKRLQVSKSNADLLNDAFENETTNLKFYFKI